MKPVTFLSCLFLISTNVMGQWTQTSGPVGAKSNEIFYVGNYLFVNGYNGGIFRSADKGLTWDPVNNGLLVDFRCFSMDVEDGKLYIGTSNGVFFSNDLGDSWRALSSAELSAFSIEVSGNEIFVGSANNVSMQYSSDGGATWTGKNSLAVQEGVRHLLKWKNILWLGTDHTVYTSPDNGTNWTLSTLDVRASSLDSADGSLFISGNDQYGFFGVYQSSDDGASWDKILSTLETNIPVSGFRKLGTSLYVSGFKTLYYSEDNGATWTHQLLPHSFNFHQQTFLTHINNQLFLSYGDGILFTADNGVTWEMRNINYKNHSIVQLAKTKKSVVSYTEDNGVYISQNDGDSWKWIPDHESYRPRQIYANDHAIVVSYLLGIYKSEDEGETWEKIFTLTDDIPGGHAIPDVHLTGWGDSLVYTTYKGLYFSPNMGKSWRLQPISSFDTNTFIFKSFFQRDTVVALTQHEFFFSIDFGLRWEKRSIPEAVTSAYYSVTDMLFEDSKITMATPYGLYSSVNLGLSWKRNECVPDPNIFDMERVGATLVLCTSTGVYASHDRVNWYSVRDDLENARALSIAIKDRICFIGTWGKSAWKRPLADLIIPREILVKRDEVPKPLLAYTCNTVTAVNAAAHLKIKWYKDGEIIQDEHGANLKTNGAGTYHVSFENDCDLKISDKVMMDDVKLPDPEVYNVLTINLQPDGKNDHYLLDPNLAGSRFTVYNRWGEIIYSNPVYENNWAPTEISAGQYFYTINSECFGTLKGIITILKP